MNDKFITLSVLKFDSSLAWSKTDEPLSIDSKEHRWPMVATGEGLRATIEARGCETFSNLAGDLMITGYGYRLDYVRVEFGPFNKGYHLVRVNGKAIAPDAEDEEPYGHGESHESLARRLRRVMPGLGHPVDYPCACDAPVQRSVWSVIQHLNDRHHPTEFSSLDMWSRERIAEWTETLPFDLTIDPDIAEADKSEHLPGAVVDEWSYLSDEQKAALTKATSEMSATYTKHIKTTFDAMVVAAKNANEALTSAFKGLPKTISEMDPAKFEMLTGLKHPSTDTKENS